MRAVTVDTNVPVVANASGNEDPDCVLACVDARESTIRERLVILDDQMYVLHEYLGHLSLSGRPGPGDAFMKWVFDHQADPARCERVAITPVPGVPGDFAEFPRDQDLADFDLSDRKFVAIALVSRHSPAVLNAVDSDWRAHEEPLKRCGVSVEFLCPHLV